MNNDVQSNVSKCFFVIKIFAYVSESVYASSANEPSKKQGPFHVVNRYFKVKVDQGFIDGGLPKR